MLQISDSTAMREAINAATDDALRALLMQQLDQLGSIDGYDLGEIAHFLVT